MLFRSRYARNIFYCTEPKVVILSPYEANTQDDIPYGEEKIWIQLGKLLVVTHGNSTVLYTGERISSRTRRSG